MNRKSPDFTPISPRQKRRMLPGHYEAPQNHALPAAFDEIFAHLALRQEQLERANQGTLNAEQVRQTAAEMGRQRTRLTQLLRDIDLSA